MTADVILYGSLFSLLVIALVLWCRLTALEDRLDSLVRTAGERLGGVEERHCKLVEEVADLQAKELKRSPPRFRTMFD